MSGASSVGMKPDLQEIRAARDRIAGKVRVTPTMSYSMRDLDVAWPNDAEAIFKLELFQVTGTFKARAAINGMLSLTPEQRAKGVTAVSAGNHAVAVSYAAKALDMSAKVVMIKTANPLRVELAKSFGARVEFAEHGPAAFARVKEIEAQEGRVFIHPFEGPGPVTGTATLGLEWFEQSRAMDAVIVACGGGGLLGGVAAAMKQLSPSTIVYGVEPEGADSMFQSFQKGEPVTLPKIATIADSLAPPMATPYTFGVCKQFVSRIVRVSDAQIRDAMRLTFRTLKLAVEPAGAVALAGVLGPLRDELRGKRRIGILVCGSNIDQQTFCAQLSS